MGAGLKPPKKLICHSHWTRNGQKMSKSLQNVVDPSELLDRGVSTDLLRYALLRDGRLASDSDFAEEKISLMNGSLSPWF